MVSEKVTKFVIEIRARTDDGVPYPFWMDTSSFNTLKEAKKYLKDYRKKYNYRLKIDSHIKKITTESEYYDN